MKYKREVIDGYQKKQHPSYKSWDCMKQRCLNPNNRNYFRYGGRGITVCDRWLDFKNFAEDMGVCQPGLSLDRIDNDGNYEPGNCRWATRTEQMLNRPNFPYGETGYRGVRVSTSKKFTANAKVDGRMIYIGTFETAEAANDAVIEFKRSIGR